jgi:hypothetical protein
MSQMADWKARIEETAGRIARLLATDARRFVTETVREAFVADTRPVDAEAVRRIKARTLETAETVASRLSEAITAVDWLVVEAPEDSRAAKITDVDAVASAVEGMCARISALLEETDLTAEVTYTLPQRFIEHDSLPTLTRTLYKAIARYAELHAEDIAQRSAQTAAARRQLWEQA